MDRPRTLRPLRCLWIYEQYKKNLQRESFCLRALLRWLKLLVPFRPLPAAPPFHFIKFEDGCGCLRPRPSPPPSPAPHVLSLRPDLWLLFFLCFHAGFCSFFPLPFAIKSPISLPPAPFVCPDSHVIVGHVRDGPAYLGTAVRPEASLFPFHCDWLPKEKRDTCFLARRLSAAFVINAALGLSQLLDYSSSGWLSVRVHERRLASPRDRKGPDKQSCAAAHSLCFIQSPVSVRFFPHKWRFAASMTLG